MFPLVPYHRLPVLHERIKRPTGEHTHFFSARDHPEGGHYHGDVSPDSIHYEGFFTPRVK